MHALNSLKKILNLGGCRQRISFSELRNNKKKKSANNYKIKEKIKEKFINLFSDN